VGAGPCSGTEGTGATGGGPWRAAPGWLKPGQQGASREEAHGGYAGVRVNEASRPGPVAFRLDAGSSDGEGMEDERPWPEDGSPLGQLRGALQRNMRAREQNGWEGAEQWSSIAWPTLPLLLPEHAGVAGPWVARCTGATPGVITAF